MRQEPGRRKSRTGVGGELEQVEAGAGYKKEQKLGRSRTRVEAVAEVEPGQGQEHG